MSLPGRQVRYNPDTGQMQYVSREATRGHAGTWEDIPWGGGGQQQTGGHRPQNFRPRLPMHGATLSYPGIGTTQTRVPGQQGITDPLTTYGESMGGVNYRLPFVPPPGRREAPDHTGAVEAEMLRQYRIVKPEHAGWSDSRALDQMLSDEISWKNKKKGSPWKEEAVKNVLAQQTSEQQAEAKYWNEYRYAQGLDFLEQRFGNVMGQLQGMGEQEKQEIRDSFEALQGKLDQKSLGAGLTGTTVRGAQSRGLNREQERALGEARETNLKQKLGYETILSSDIVNFIQQRSDAYPSVTDMANLYFGYGQSGGGQAAPKAESSTGSAAAGIGAGLAMAFLCCWIFLEARYGDGTMDKVVRRFRDEMMNARNRRGYYKMAEVLVPLMRRHWWAKWLVRLTMTDPLVCYGKWHYKQPGVWGKLGWVFAPVKSFWLSTWEFLGGEFEFVRANGEVI